MSCGSRWARGAGACTTLAMIVAVMLGPTATVRAEEVRTLAFGRTGDRVLDLSAGFELGADSPPPEPAYYATDHSYWVAWLGGGMTYFVADRWSVSAGLVAEYGHRAHERVDIVSSATTSVSVDRWRLAPVVGASHLLPLSDLAALWIRMRIGLGASWLSQLESDGALEHAPIDVMAIDLSAELAAPLLFVVADGLFIGFGPRIGYTAVVSDSSTDAETDIYRGRVSSRLVFRLGTTIGTWF